MNRYQSRWWTMMQSCRQGLKEKPGLAWPGMAAIPLVSIAALLLLPGLAACNNKSAGPVPVVTPAGDHGKPDSAKQVDSRSAYDKMVLAEDKLVGYWTLSGAGATEPDLTSHHNTGTYEGNGRSQTQMPNGDKTALFDGATNLLTVPSSGLYSIPTKHELTWEVWVQPTTLNFPNHTHPKKPTDHYVEIMGKCERFSPTCEWESRMYVNCDPKKPLCDPTKPCDLSQRPSRMSAYAFKLVAGKGSGAHWQPDCGLIQPGEWLHIVGEYTTLSQPGDCLNAKKFPGSINIWVNGVKWARKSNYQTGCMSQYRVKPQIPPTTSTTKPSPLNIGTMARDGWFKGGIGKVAIYDRLLDGPTITAH